MVASSGIAAPCRTRTRQRRKDDDQETTALQKLTGGGGLGLVTATLVANGGNFAFHAVVSRRLGVEAYGAVGALLSILLILSLPTAALQLLVAREVARHRAAGVHVDASRIVGTVGAGVVAAAVLVTLGAPILRGFLHLESAWPVIWMGVYLIPAFIGMAARAVLLGHLRFGVVGATLIAGTVARILVVLALLGAGGGVASALAASAVSETIMAAVFLVAARDSLRGSGVRMRVLWRDGLSTAVTFVGLWALVGVDVVLARHFLPAEEAGGYAAAATLARGALLVPQAIAWVAHARWSGDTEDRGLLRWSMAATAGAASGVAVALVVVRQPAVNILFGAAFEVSPLLLGLLGTCSAGLAVANLLVHHQQAHGLPAAAPPWAATAIGAAFVTAWHPHPLAVASGALAAVACAVALLGADALRLRRPRARLARRAPCLHGPGELDLSVVVPYYNSGPALRAHLENLLATLGAQGVTFELLTVDDGCTDRTHELVRSVRHPAVRHLRLSANRGKGEALRRGFTESRGRYVGFIDADGDLDASQLRPFVELMRLYQPDAVIGSKRHPLSEVDYPPLRRVYSWGFQQLARMLFRLSIRDTQTGIKLYRREVLVEALPATSEEGFVFDLELLAIAYRLGYRRMFEAPVRLTQRFGSTVSARTAAQMLTASVRLAYRLRVAPPIRRSEPAESVAAAPLVASTAELTI